MIIFRTGLSERTVFEVAYNIFKGNNIPIFMQYKIIENCIDNILEDTDFFGFLK